MIRPAGEIEFPPSEFLHMKACMLARMEALNTSTDSLISVIAQRLGAEKNYDICMVNKLTDEQDRLIKNMRRLACA